MPDLLRDWDILDLTKAERKTLSGLLEHGTMSVSETARKTDVARTTVDAALRRLRDRKLVRKAAGRPKGSSGRAQFWQAVEVTTVQHELSDAAIPYEKTEGPQSMAAPLDTPEVAVFKGKQQIQKAYKELLTRSEGDTLVFIQGNQAAKRVSKRPNERYMLAFHDDFRRSGGTVEGVSGVFIEDFLKTLPLDELQAHFGHLVESTLVPDEFMDFDLEAVVLDDTALLLDPKTETVVELRNPNIVRFFENVSRLLRAGKEKVDLNTKARSRIVEEWRKG